MLFKLINKIKENKKEKREEYQRMKVTVLNLYTGEKESFITDRAGLTGIAISGCYDLVDVEYL